MPRRFTRKRLFAVTVVLLTALALLATLAASRGWSRRMLAERWSSDLETLPAEQVPLRLREIAELGDAGIEQLVKSLGSQQSHVSRGAFDVLREQLERWRMLDSRRSSAEVARLAELLAIHAAKFHSQGCAMAAELATQVLLWPVDREVIDSARLLSHCEVVLRQSAAKSSEQSSPTEVNVTSQPVSDRSDGAAKPAFVFPPVAVRDGDLPAGISQRPLLPPPSLLNSLRINGDAPESKPAATAADSAPREFTSPPVARHMFQDDATLEITDSTTPPAQSDSIRSPSGSPRSRDASQLQSQPDLEVMRLLHTDDPVLARTAVDELRRRGFTDTHIALARRLTDPDPERRLTFAEMLPRYSNIDARPWLLWLTHDPAPQVRQAAISIIATSTDPQLHKRLQELSQQATDPEVLRQVQKALPTNVRR